MRVKRFLAFWGLAGLVVFFGLLWGCFCSFPLIMLCFPPFNDDLGTPPTWRPHSWKKLYTLVILPLGQGE